MCLEEEMTQKRRIETVDQTRNGWTQNDCYFYNNIFYDNYFEIHDFVQHFEQFHPILFIEIQICKFKKENSKFTSFIFRV